MQKEVLPPKVYIQDRLLNWSWSVEWWIMFLSTSLFVFGLSCILVFVCFLLLLKFKAISVTWKHVENHQMFESSESDD